MRINQRAFAPSLTHTPRSTIRIAKMAPTSHATSSLNFTLQDPQASPPSQNYGTILYTHCLCPYAERAWLALLEKVTVPGCGNSLIAFSFAHSLQSFSPVQGTPFHLVQIDLSSKPSWYRTINPRGLVPAVSHNGKIIIESLDIIRWADRELEGPSLTPSDSLIKQRMDKIISAGSVLSDAGLSILSGRSGRYWGIGSDPSQSQKKSFEQALKKGILDPVEESGGPYLMGESVTLADIAVYPFVKRFAVACPEFSGYDVYKALNGAVGKWLKAMEERPACRVSSADDGLLLKAYRKHRSLDFFDYDSYLCCDLHPQNEKYRSK